MMLKEKAFRFFNSFVQGRNISVETKILSENTVLAMDIVNKLERLISENSGTYAQRKTVNEKLRKILDEI